MKRFLREQKKAGKTILMVTLTLQHNASMGLNNLWSTVEESMKYVTTGESWTKRIRDTFGITDWIKVFEVTLGSGGWHPHCHMILISDRAPSDLAVLEEKIFARWEKAVSDRGYRTVRGQGGIETSFKGDPDHLADYLEKGHRLPNVATEEAPMGDNGSLMPFEIGLLATSSDIAEVNRRKYERYWHEWEYATLNRRSDGKNLGRRAMTWSNNLNSVLGENVKDPEDDSEKQDYTEFEPADFEKRLPKTRTVLILPRRTYVLLGAGIIDLLEIIEDHGIDAAVAWLDSKHLDYELPPLPGSQMPIDWDDSPYSEWRSMAAT